MLRSRQRGQKMASSRSTLFSKFCKSLIWCVHDWNHGKYFPQVKETVWYWRSYSCGLLSWYLTLLVMQTFIWCLHCCCRGGTTLNLHFTSMTFTQTVRRIRDTVVQLISLLNRKIQMYPVLNSAFSRFPKKFYCLGDSSRKTLQSRAVHYLYSKTQYCHLWRVPFK